MYGVTITRAGWMEGVDESTELWQHPLANYNIRILSTVSKRQK